MKQAKKYLHRTKKEDDGSEHKANVCIVCDCFIIGTKSMCYLRANAIKKHKHRIGVESYETYYKTKLHKELIEQYHMPNFPELILSPRSKKTQKGYVTCSACCNSIQRSNEKNINPHKYAIANGFVICSFPKVITFVNKDGNEEKRDVDAEVDISDVL